jgi:hypothetical protein
MPFDFPAEPSVITVPRTLEGLAFALRHRELWPVGFEWNYKECKKCAMGLAYRLWDLGHYGNACTYGLVETCGQEHNTEKFRDIFVRLGADVPGGMSDITPEHVADAIDRYLESR